MLKYKLVTLYLKCKLFDSKTHKSHGISILLETSSQISRLDYISHQRAHDD